MSIYILIYLSIKQYMWTDFDLLHVTTYMNVVHTISNNNMDASPTLNKMLNFFSLILSNTPPVYDYYLFFFLSIEICYRLRHEYL